MTDDLAVTGQHSQHNDALLSELCNPPLSSVIPNARQVGWEAAAMPTLDSPKPWFDPCANRGRAEESAT